MTSQSTGIKAEIEQDRGTKQIHAHHFGDSLRLRGRIWRKTFAGFPATIAFAGTSFVTTQPAPTIAFSPMTILERIVAPEPTEAPFLTRVRSTFQSLSVCKWPSEFVARG